MSGNIFIKIWKHRRDLYSIIKSVYFNFHYLPFKHAIKLPILLYKPKFFKLQGHIKIGGVKLNMA